jgi:uncharacterized glyoxalase superfamily protein PhnB
MMPFMQYNLSSVEENGKMPRNPPEGMPRVTPYLCYADVEAALGWLEKTFGFARGGALPGPDGVIMHAEMKFKEGVIMMGPPCAEQGSKSPKELAGVNQSLYIYVDTVDEHYRHAKQAGATPISEPIDMFWGDRMCTVKDLEGHQWSFAQHVKDIAPEDMQPSFS